MSYADDLLENHRGGLIHKLALLWLNCDEYQRCNLELTFPFLAEGNYMQHRPKPSEIKAWLDARQVEPEGPSDNALSFKVDYEGKFFTVHLYADTGDLIDISLGEYDEMNCLLSYETREALDLDARRQWEQFNRELEEDQQ